MTRLALWQQRWPMIEWCEPVMVTWPTVRTYSCRICIAELGLKKNSLHQWHTAQEAREHIQAEHLTDRGKQ